MGFRIATLNLERDEKRWPERRELISLELSALRPDILCLNEVWLPLHAARWLNERTRIDRGLDYTLLEQRRADSPSHPEAEALMTTFSVVERSHRFFSARDTVTFVSRLQIQNQLVDVYVTHLYPDRFPESARVTQINELLAWITERDDIENQIVCGDCNATLAAESMQLMARRFRPTQTQHTAFSPLREANGQPTHPEWERFDRCIDFIWIAESIGIQRGGLCFDNSSEEDPTLWPSDHVGVWADLALK